MVEFIVIDEGDLFGSFISYTNDKNQDSSTLHILGPLDKTRKAFSLIIDLHIRDVFEKRVDFEKIDIEVEVEEVSFVFVQCVINKFKHQKIL